jgi:sugar phosphate isomerase/epimerase
LQSPLTLWRTVFSLHTFIQSRNNIAENMKFILSTGSLYTYSTERCFRFAADAGFDGIELMVDYRWETRQSDFLQRLMDTIGLPVLAVHSPFRPVPGWNRHSVSELIDQSITLAEALGSPVVIHHLPTIIDVGILDYWGGRAVIPVGTRLQSAYRDWLCTQYAQRQRETAVTLCIENLPAAKIGGKPFNYGVWNTPDSITRFPHICMDTTHLGTFGLQPAPVYRRWRHHVRHIHLSNFDGRQHRRPETGQLRLDDLLAHLAQDGYDQAVSLELNPDALDAGAPDAQIIQHLRVSLEHCRSWAIPVNSEGRDDPRPVALGEGTNAE